MRLGGATGFPIGRSLCVSVCPMDTLSFEKPAAGFVQIAPAQPVHAGSK